MPSAPRLPRLALTENNHRLAVCVRVESCVRLLKLLEPTRLVYVRMYVRTCVNTSPGTFPRMAEGGGDTYARKIQAPTNARTYVRTYVPMVQGVAGTYTSTRTHALTHVRAYVVEMAYVAGAGQGRGGQAQGKANNARTHMCTYVRTLEKMVAREGRAGWGTHVTMRKMMATDGCKAHERHVAGGSLFFSLPKCVRTYVRTYGFAVSSAHRLTAPYARVLPVTSLRLRYFAPIHSATQSRLL